MKKVLAILAVVGFASFGFADEPVDIGTNMASFEGLTTNTSSLASGGLLDITGELDTTADDTGHYSGNKYWFLFDGDNRDSAELIVTPYETNASGVISYNYGDLPRILTGVQSNYLSLCTVDQPLSRSVLPCGAKDPLTQTRADISNGIYIDTLIQFQPSEMAPTVDVLSGEDQLLVWMQEVEADEGAGIEAATNLVVTAGYLKTSDNQLDATNYVVTVADTTVNPGEWHRLTVKSIKEIGTATGVAGFVVFIDGKVATSTESRGVAGSVLGNLNPAAADWYEQNALFPSLRIYLNGNAGSLAAVSFDGTGAIDDLSIARSAPFPGANDKTRLRIEITDGVKGVTVTWGTQTETLELDAFEEGKATIVMQESGDVVATVTAIYDEDNGWKKHKDGWLVVGDSCEETVEDETYTIALGTMGDIVVRAFQPKFMVGDEEFDSLDGDTGAIAAAAAGSTAQAPGTIKLLADYEGQVVIPEKAYIVLDLAGNTIVGVYDELVPDSQVAIVNYGWLKIINSTVEVGMVIGAEYTPADSPDPVIGEAIMGDSAIATIVEGGIIASEIVCADECANLSIVGGWFYDTNYKEDVWNPTEEFYLLDAIVSGKNIEPDEEKGAGIVKIVDGTVGTLTLPEELPTGIASMTVYQAATADDDDWGNALTGDENVYSITAGNFYKVVVTPATGYQLKDSLVNAIISEEAVEVDGEYEVEATALAALVKAVPTVDYTITGNNTVVLAITNGTAETESLTGVVVVGDTLKIVATAIDGYAFSGEEAPGTGWAFADEVWTFTATAVEDTPITVTVPTATALPTTATLTLPEELPTGIASMTVYQAATADADDWGNALTGDENVYSITAGNFYKVAVTADTGYELKDPAVDAIISDAAVTAGEAITIAAADLEALVQQTATDPWADVVTDDISGVTAENKAQVAAQLNALKTAGGFTDEAATKAWLEKFYNKDNQLSAETLLAAKNLGISTKYDLPLMTAETPVIEFNATVAATEGNVAAFTFQIKDGTEGEAVSLAVAKVLDMVQYCSTLGSWGAATDTNVDVSVSGTTATVQLKQTSAAAGFMKVVLTPPAE